MNIGSVLNEFITILHLINQIFTLLLIGFEINDFHLKISPTI